MHELRLRVDIGDGLPADQLERHVRVLFQDLRRLGALRVERATAAPPAGSMAGVGQDLAVLVLSGAFSAASLKAVGNVVVAYVNRTKARAVEWEFDGNKGSFTALSAKDQHALVEAVTARIAAGAAQGDGSDGAGETDGGAPDRTADRD
ncbi:effector-associated constant component EACC1 [Streptomyces mexicanus]|uniref:effector-associated constant component EACC1 n=1 Tax=Streptomyces mexicanus TaxID=178566 RepID=UPI003646C2A5